MQPGDFGAVRRLWEEAGGVGLSDADGREGVARYLARNPGLSFVAVSAGALVGAVLAGHDGRRGFIHHLAVRGEWRRRGLGRLLVDRCLDALAREHIQKCHILVIRDNPDGQRFWREIGWIPRTELEVLSHAVGRDR